MRITNAAYIAAFFLGSAALSEEGHAPYSGFEAREIAALSASDIEELEAGGGWGLALPAELNGYPGPTHVLELSEALGLSAAQQTQISEIYDSMRTEAITAGLALIDAERALHDAFASGDINETTLTELVSAAGTARSTLRLIHLSRHLMTINILDHEQIARYEFLRGYVDDPCITVPEGHDPAMWRSHNGCDG